MLLAWTRSPRSTAASPPANRSAGRWAGPRSKVAAIAACPCSSMDRRPQYRVGLHGLGDQRRIIGNVAIPFDEHGLRAGSIEKTRQQVPATRAHPRSIVVERDGAPPPLVLARMARPVDFPATSHADHIQHSPRTPPPNHGRT